MISPWNCIQPERKKRQEYSFIEIQVTQWSIISIITGGSALKGKSHILANVTTKCFMFFNYKGQTSWWKFNYIYISESLFQSSIKSADSWNTHPGLESRVPPSCTYQHVSFPTQPLPVVVSCNHLKLEVGSPHVVEEHGCLDESCVCFHHKPLFALFNGWYDEPVGHGTIVSRVPVGSLGGKNQMINHQWERSKSLQLESLFPLPRLLV